MEYKKDPAERRDSTSYDIPTLRQECRVILASCNYNVKNSFISLNIMQDIFILFADQSLNKGLGKQFLVPCLSFLL
jgi:hypothetical protein